jgi:hypothetical protein
MIRVISLGPSARMSVLTVDHSRNPDRNRSGAAPKSQSVPRCFAVAWKLFRWR